MQEIWGRKAQDLGPKHAEFGSKTRESMGPKDLGLGPDFALPIGAVFYKNMPKITKEELTTLNL
jgi:hypothetical protein